MKLYRHITGADPGFQVRGGGAYLKNLRRAEGGAKICGVFRVKNHDFTQKNHIFSNFRGGGAPGAPPPPPPGAAPVLNVKIFLCVNRNTAWSRHHDFSITTPLYAKE